MEFIIAVILGVLAIVVGVLVALIGIAVGWFILTRTKAATFDASYKDRGWQTPPAANPKPEPTQSAHSKKV